MKICLKEDILNTGRGTLDDLGVLMVTRSPADTGMENSVARLAPLTQRPLEPDEEGNPRGAGRHPRHRVELVIDEMGPIMTGNPLAAMTYGTRARRSPSG